MATNVKITDMTPGAAITGTEMSEAVQSSSTVSLTTLQQRTYAIATAYTYNVPVDAFSLTIANLIQVLVLNPAGTLATGTITMPSAPVDGQRVRLASTQIITALTLNANMGQTIDNAISAFTAGGFAEYIYRTALTKWFRIG